MLTVPFPAPVCSRGSGALGSGSKGPGQAEPGEARQLCFASPHRLEVRGHLLAFEGHGKLRSLNVFWKSIAAQILFFPLPSGS